MTDDEIDCVIELFRRVVSTCRSLSFQIHFNHPQELSTEDVGEAVARIRSTGSQIRTQSHLMRNINDKPDIWVKMWRKQVDMGIIPYYIFVALDTGSKKYFEIPLERCWNIFREAYRQVSGLCRTVRVPSMSDNAVKIQILGVAEVKGEKFFVLRFIQGRNTKWVHVPFFAQYDHKATWFSQLKPAFGEDEFFFEDERGKVP